MTRSTETHLYGRPNREDSEGGDREGGSTLTVHCIFRGEQTGTITSATFSFLVPSIYLPHPP